MAQPRLQHGLTVLVLICAVAGAGCTVEDDLVTQIGSTRIFFVDSGLRQQRLEDSAEYVPLRQHAESHEFRHCDSIRIGEKRTRSLGGLRCCWAMR